MIDLCILICSDITKYFHGPCWSFHCIEKSILKIILLMFQKVNHTGLDNMRVSKWQICFLLKIVCEWSVSEVQRYWMTTAETFFKILIVYRCLQSVRMDSCTLKSRLWTIKTHILHYTIFTNLQKMIMCLCHRRSHIRPSSDDQQTPTASDMNIIYTNTVQENILQYTVHLKPLIRSAL